MTKRTARWMRGAVAAAAAGAVGGSPDLRAQDFKVPLSLSHFVYRPAENAEPLENLRAWTFGLGVIVGSRPRTGYGLVGHATYGGPYWYVSGSAGMWNSGSTAVDDFAFGVTAHYNVFQSRDYRTRLGWQFGWSRSRSGEHRTQAFDYRAVASHALSRSLSLYGAMGAETSRSSPGGRSDGGTHPSLLGGLNARLGQRFALSGGIETVFADPTRLRFAGSVQFETDYGEDSESAVSRRDRSSRRPPGS